MGAEETKETVNDTNKELISKFQDLMLTFPTLLIIQNRKEEALY